MSPLDEVASLSSRVAVLEDWREEHRAWMKEIASGLSQANTSLLAMRLCSAPDTCLSLQKDIVKLAVDSNDALTRIAVLEKRFVFISGVVATVGVVWTVVQVLVLWALKLLPGAHP